MMHRPPYYFPHTMLPLALVSLPLSLVSLPTAASATTKINYVALGDSYSSGEGLASEASGYINNPYITGSDGCHRANDAYPELVKARFGSSLGSFRFVACSGAYSGETTPVNKIFDAGGSMVSGRDNEAPQLSTTYLNSSVNDISITIGGNDAGFANVALSCTSVMSKTGPIKQVIGLPPLMTGGSCKSMLVDSKKIIGDGTANSDLGSGLVKTYTKILDDAKNARLAVLTYPQLLTPKQIPSNSFCPLTGGGFAGPSRVYLGFNSKVQGDINAMEAGVNKDIASAVANVASQSRYQGRIRLVNVTRLTIPQPCDTKTMSLSDINGIDFAPGYTAARIIRCIASLHISSSCVDFSSNKTLHPTKAGHQVMAAALEAAFKANWRSSTLGTSSSYRIVSDGYGYCAILTSGGVDCWGQGQHGQLGNGQFYTSGNFSSARPVSVVGTGGTGTLSGVTSLVAEANNGALDFPGGGYCAILTSGEVDCWGAGAVGQLGNGTLGDSAVPVPVVGISGSGNLRGVTSLTGGGPNICALLTSSEVDCWGAGASNPNVDPARPESVVGISGTGTLSGVTSLASDAYGKFCALLTSSGVVCWSFLGGSAIPVPVVGTSGTGTLSGVTSLASDSGFGFCAILNTSGVDCWGEGASGELGNGQFYAPGSAGSAVPVPVVGISGTGTLDGVKNLAGGSGNYCALLTTGGVDCWGSGSVGELGNGKFYTSGNAGSAVPVAVVTTTGLGTMSGVIRLTSGASGSTCATLQSGGVDCWGGDTLGELGSGQIYPYGEAVPVEVIATSGLSPLGGVS